MDIDIIKEEIALNKGRLQLEQDIAVAQDVYLKCVTVVGTIYDDLRLALAERQQLLQIIMEPAKYGTTANKAKKTYNAHGRELRAVKRQLEDAQVSINRAQRSLDLAKSRLLANEKALKKNEVAQRKAGLMPPLPRQSVRLSTALEELAQYTGLLDGSW